MRYMLLIYDREADWAKLKEQDQGALYAEYGVFTEGIRKSGHYKAGDPLQTIATATTVRVRNGKTVTTDGPFAETRELLYTALTRSRRSVVVLGGMDLLRTAAASGIRRSSGIGDKLLSAAGPA